MSSKLAEKKLLYRVCSKQDADAFGELYDIYVKRIYRFVFFKVSSHEEAEDVTSEVFLKAWHYIAGRENNIASFSGFLYRLARNTIVDLYRAKRSRTEQLDIAQLEIADGGKWYIDVCAKVENEKILNALKKLKQEYQEVITLRHIDELEIDEIAEIVGKGRIAVRVTLHRAMKKLKELCQDR